MVGSPYQSVPRLSAGPLRSSPFPVQSGYLPMRQQQAEAFAPSNANTSEDGVHGPFFEEHLKDTQCRQSTGSQVSTAPGNQLSLKLKIVSEPSRAGPPADQRAETSTSSMTILIQPAQRVVLASSVTRGLPNCRDGLPCRPSGDVCTRESCGPPILSSSSPRGGYSTFPTCLEAVSAEPRPSSSMSPRSTGSKRSREDGDESHVLGSNPKSSAVSHGAKLASGTNLGDTTPNSKRLRARLPCVDQYVALRKDLDVLLSAVAGGLSAQQGVIVAAALKEMSAR